MNISRVLVIFITVSCTFFAFGCVETRTRAGMPRTDVASSHYSLGTKLLNLGKYEDAVVALEKAVSLEPTAASAQLNLGISLTRVGHYEQAIKALQESDRLRSNYFPTIYGFANAYYAAGRFKEAGNYYGKAWSMDGFNPSYFPFILSVLSYRFAGEHSIANKMLQEGKASSFTTSAFGAYYSGSGIGRDGVNIANYLKGQIDRETMLEKGAKYKLIDQLGPILISGMNAAQKQDISLAEKDLNYVLQKSNPRWDFYFLAKATLARIPGNLSAPNSIGTDTAEKVNTTSDVESISNPNLDEASLSNSNEQLTPRHDITGTYASKITRGTDYWFLNLKSSTPKVKIQQTGNNVKGTFGKGSGNFDGVIVGDTITIEWYTARGNGEAKWTMIPESNQLVGSYSENGIWNLKKIQ